MSTEFHWCNLGVCAVEVDSLEGLSLIQISREGFE